MGKPSKRKGKERQYTPETDPLASLLNDPALLAGFPDWSKQSEYFHIYKDLRKVDIPNRPPTLPTLYEYVGGTTHPLRHLTTNV